MREIVGEERDALVLDVLKRIDSAKPHADAEAWERGWQQALEDFRADPREESLVPAFIKPAQPLRWVRRFWHADDPQHELKYVRGLHSWLDGKFHRCDTIYEFGCGTGFNLAALARLAPQKSYCGFDLSKHAVELVREMGVKLDLPIGADRFNMLEPVTFDFQPESGVFTFGAMEQLGTFRPFIDYLIEQRPKIVCHIEPIPELLDERYLVDWLSLRFHEKRGYTRGMLPYLQNHPRVEIIEVERSYFGSLMLESYAKVVWRPK